MIFVHPFDDNFVFLFSYWLKIRYIYIYIYIYRERERERRAIEYVREICPKIVTKWL